MSATTDPAKESREDANKPDRISSEDKDKNGTEADGDDKKNDESANGRVSLGKRKASGDESRPDVDQKKCRKWQETLREDEETKKVYIWDLDETLIIFQSLLSGE